MRTKTLRRRPASIPKRRWAAYATAGAATALAGSNSAEAAIHYSGRLEVEFPRHEDKTQVFQLDQPGDSLWFHHSASTFGGNASFTANGIVSAGFRGSIFDALYVSKLSFGQRISAGGFITHNQTYDGKLASIGGAGQWRDPGVGFIGFKFNNGGGVQYGWARVRMGGASKQNGFKLIDYAYADPGQPIRAGEDGQRRIDPQGSDQSSLGWLAVGAVGLLAWRKARAPGRVCN